MEIGPIIALVAAMLFAGANIFIRRGTYQSEESFTATAIGVFAGIFLLLFILPLTGDWNKLWSLSWQGFIQLSVAGMIHFVVGRYFLFNCIRLIGANKAGAIARLNLVLAVTFAVVFLHESLTTPIIMGIICLLFGVMLVGFEPEREVFRMQSKGLLNGLAAVLCTGTSAVLIKPAVSEIGSPYAATFISYSAAFLLVSLLLIGKGRRDQLLNLPRCSTVNLTIAGTLSWAGQLLRYTALIFSPVTVVQPLMGTVVLFTLFLSFLMNRNIDVFNWRVITGIMITAIGTFLLFL